MGGWTPPHDVVGGHHPPAHVGGWTPPADFVPVNFLQILARNGPGIVENQHNLAQSHQNFDPSPTVTTGKPPDPTFGPFSGPWGVKQIFHHPLLKKKSWRKMPPGMALGL